MGDDPMADDTVARRSEAAEAAWQDYDLDGMSVEGVQGWEHDSRSPQVTRNVYLRDPDAPGGDSVKGHVSVDFASPDGDVVVGIEAFADGVPVGRPGGAAPRP